MRNISRISLAVAVLGFAHFVSAAGVDTNLGTLAPGSYPFSGTTAGADNDIDTYAPEGNPAAMWDQDYIYQFTINQPMNLSLTTNDLDTDPDNDFFLTQSLATTVNSNGLREANAIGELAFVNGDYPGLSAGTYYFIVDAWRGNPTAVGTPASGRAGPFSGTLTFSEFGSAPASTAVNVGGSISGNLAAGEVQWFSFTLNSPTAVSFDTEGTTLASSNDTELFLYDSAGTLLGTDDDDGTGLLSVLDSGDELPAQLAAGTYYLALGSFNTVGNPGFSVSSTSSNSGAFVINGISVIPEPTSLATIALAGLGLRRRRA
jgi:hypothetical protein